MKRLGLAMCIISLCLLFSCGETPETFKVIYHDNGSTSGYPPVDNNEYESGSYATVLDKGTLIKEGYEFDAWNTRQDGTGTPYASGSKIEIKNINIFLFATWK
jgi:major membrane immunogen (membrane-anchored lipoprotein)